MENPSKKAADDKRAQKDGRGGLYGLLVDVSQLALALARTYENRPPPMVKRGRPHAV